MWRVYSVVRAHQRGWQQGLALSISLAMAMGSILYFPMIRFFPGLNLTTPTRILYIFGFTISVLAAFGAQALICSPSEKKGWIVALWTIPVVLGILLFFFSRSVVGIWWATRHMDPEEVARLFHLYQKHFSPGSPILLKPMLLIGISFFLHC